MNNCLTCGGPGQGYHGVRDVEPLKVPNLVGPGTLAESIHTHFLRWILFDLPCLLTDTLKYNKHITWYIVKYKLYGHRDTLNKWVTELPKEIYAD